jgi:hypothetical protein
MSERREGHTPCRIPDDDWKELKRDVKETREKVFNGLSGLPKTIMWGFGIIITLLVATVGIVGSTRFQTAQTEQALQDHLSWGERQNEVNTQVFRDIESRLDDIERCLPDE